MRNLSPARGRRSSAISFHTAPAVVAWVLTRPRSGPGWRAYSRQDFITTAGTVPANATEAPLPPAIEAEIAAAESASRGVS